MTIIVIKLCWTFENLKLCPLFLNLKKYMDRLGLKIEEILTNQNGQPIEVPTLCLQTDEQRAEYEAAKKRKQLRKQRRQEGFWQ